LLKPIAPKEYDGLPDARNYHRFITEGTDYVMTGKVAVHRRVFVLSYYLSGRAYDFYTQKVAINVYEWTLQDFFEEMFNYCFPINYRLRQREKLKRSFQNEKSVSEYCYELEELYNMIGTIDVREKVIKLWFGLRGIIQKGLWRDGLNPEVSTWDQVKNTALIIEIAEGVPETRNSQSDRRFGSSSWHRGSLGHGSGSNGQEGPRSSGNSSSVKKAVNDNVSAKGQGGRPNGNQHRGTVQALTGRGATSPRTDRSTPKLSDRERNELLASGKCFRCKEPGHLSWNCPRGNSVQSGRPNRPPGISSNNIEVDFNDVDRLRTWQRQQL
jgi:hypothetical protein